MLIRVFMKAAEHFQSLVQCFSERRAAAPSGSRVLLFVLLLSLKNDSPPLDVRLLLLRIVKHRVPAASSQQATPRKRQRLATPND